MSSASDPSTNTNIWISSTNDGEIIGGDGLVDLTPLRAGSDLDGSNTAVFLCEGVSLGDVGATDIVRVD